MIVKIKPKELNGVVKAIPSKSDLHRALMISAISENQDIILTNVNMISDDVMATINCLKNLGAKINIKDNSIEVSSIDDVYDRTVDINCNESGTTLRLLLPTVSALASSVNIDCEGNLRNRPIKELVEALKDSGLEFKFSENIYPINFSGEVVKDTFEIRGDISSQYISGLLILSSLINKNMKIKLKTNLESRAYVDMTLDVLNKFGIEVKETENYFEVKGGRDLIKLPSEYSVDGDWSNSAFFVVAGSLAGNITVNNLNLNSVQGDKKVFEILKENGADIEEKDNNIIVKQSRLKGFNVDFSEIPDLFPIIAVLAALSDGKSILSGGKRLRYKESDRIKSTFNMLKNLGADVKEIEDGLEITGKEYLNGGTVDSFFDHRIVMAASIASIKCKNEVIIENFEAVNKSYPNFIKDFEKIGGSCNVIC